MRKFAYSTVQMAWDVLITLLFIRPYVQTASFFSGKLAVFGTIILMIVPTITATLLFVVNNLGKEEKNKRNFMLLIFAIIVISACLVYYIKPTALALIITIVVMAAIECGVAEIYTKTNLEGKDTPKSFLNVFFDFGLALLTWKYLCSTSATDVSWIKIIPEWGIILITLVIVLLSVFLQFAGEKFLKADTIIGVVIAGTTTMAWVLMDRKEYLADSFRIVLLLLFSVFLYIGVLYFGEKFASDEK